MSGDPIARLTRAARSDGNAVVAFDPDTAAGQQGRSGALADEFVAVKDNLCTLEYDTTCASRMLQGYRSPFQATAVARVKQAGGVIACKTNLDEFAMGSTTEHSVFGPTRHPLDSRRVPGGSSGGSAALVADGTVDYALGTDTGGSVRQPAAFCGVVGVKPGYGRISRRGLISFASSLDHVGVFGKDVACAARLLHVVSGPDDGDSTSSVAAPIGVADRPATLAGMTIGLPREYYQPGLSAGVDAACGRAVARLRDLGATVTSVSLPHTDLAVAAYYVIAPAEASANLARYDGVRYGSRTGAPVEIGEMYRANRTAGFGVEVKRRIIIGTHVLSGGYYDEYYTHALAARREITSDFTRVFAAGVDLLFTPTTPTTAFMAGSFADDPLGLYRSDAFVCPANLAGIPALSLPIATHEGLPVGGQFIGPPDSETSMLGVARALEASVDPAEEVV